MIVTMSVSVPTTSSILTVAMIMAVGVAVGMAVVVMMTKRCHSHEIHQQAEAAYNQKLAQPFRLCALP